MAEGLAIHGIPASPGRRRARARVLIDETQFGEIAAGELLVTRFAAPSVVLVFDRIAGLVTDQGGRMAHAAVVAREFGVPAIVGTQVATSVIPDGARLEIDGESGSVRILSGDTA